MSANVRVFDNGDWVDWPEGKARSLNRMFGGHITAETVRHGEREHEGRSTTELSRGFVSDSRFGSGLAIKRTNRDTTRKWRRLSA